jgi:RNA-binding protein
MPPRQGGKTGITGRNIVNSSQRNYLRKQAHTLKPVVMIGQQGLSEALVNAAVQALASHELIKVKFQDFKDSKRSLAEELATRSDSQVVAIIGNILILFRPADDPAERRYRLPE